MSQPSPRSFVAGAMVLLALGSGALKAQDPPAPTAADTLFQMGVDRLSLEKYQEAEDAFRRLVALEPESPRGILGIAKVYLAQRKVDDAIRFLQAEAGKAPTHPDLHFAIGDIALQSARYDLAITEFQIVLDGTDKNSKSAGELYFLLGEAYRGKGELDFSIKLLRQAQKLEPANATIAIELAFVLDASGQRQAAAAAYRKILEAQPGNGIVMNNLAFLLADEGTDLDLALAYVHRARHMAPNEPSFADTLGWVYLKMGSTDDATAIFRDLLQKYPARAEYRYHLGAALDQKGQRDEATKELQAALKDNPSKAVEQKINELLQKIRK